MKSGEHVFTRFHQISQDFTRFFFFICWSNKILPDEFQSKFQSIRLKIPKVKLLKHASVQRETLQEGCCKKEVLQKDHCQTRAFEKKASNPGIKIGAFAKKGKLSKEKSEGKKSPKKVKSPAAFEKNAKASEKSKLNAKNLEKLGEMRLKDKIALASEEETVEEAALVLKDLLSPEEKNRLWPKHQTHLKNNATPEEKQTVMVS